MRFSSRLIGSAVIMALALSPVPGLAQAAGQAPKPKQPAPKARQTRQDAGPATVQLKPEPAQPEWTKVCAKDEKAKREICYTTRDFVTDKAQRAIAVAVYDTKGKKGEKTLRILTPLGFLLSPGLRVSVDKRPPVAGRYATCLPHGCFAEAVLKDDSVNAIKNGSELNVSARNQVGAVVTFVIPMDGFRTAFDGPPIDPQVLAEQQKRTQEALQRRSDELRRRLSSQSNRPAANPAANTPPLSMN